MKIEVTVANGSSTEQPTTGPILAGMSTPGIYDARDRYWQLTLLGWLRWQVDGPWVR